MTIVLTKRGTDYYLDYNLIFFQMVPTYRLQSETNEPSLSELEKELGDLANEEQRLLNELAALRQEEEETLKAIQAEEVEAQRLACEEDRYWREYTRHRREFMQTDDESRR